MAMRRPQGQMRTQGSNKNQERDETVPTKFGSALSRSDVHQMARLTPKGHGHFRVSARQMFRAHFDGDRRCIVPCHFVRLNCIGKQPLRHEHAFFRRAPLASASPEGESPCSVQSPLRRDQMRTKPSFSVSISEAKIGAEKLGSSSLTERYL